MSLAAYPVMEARGERCAASCQRREGGKGDGGRREGGRGGREGGEEGGGEGEKSAEWGTRTARVLEDNRHAVYDLHQVRCHRPSLLALCLSTSPPIQLLQAIFPLNTLRFFRSPRTFGTSCDTEKVILSGFSTPVETFCVNRVDSYFTTVPFPR
jgi:hypothetical protein